MKLPRWLLVCLIAMIVLALPAAVALWWLNRPGPDVSGGWVGPGWGVVELRQAEEGSFDGTYSSTYGKDVGRIKIFWSPRTRRYEGTWGEGTYRFGKVTVWVTRDGSVQGEYSADPTSEFQPGDPVCQDFQWRRRERAGMFTVRTPR